MYLIPSRKLIYLAQPRTASTSIAGWLTRHNLGYRWESYPCWPESWGSHHGADLVELQALQKKGWTSFCFVRNHWDYATSFYYEHVGANKDMSFDDFMSEKDKRSFFNLTWHVPQGPWANARKTLFWYLPQLANHVLYYEHLPTNLVPFLGPQIAELPIVNKSDRAPMKELWDQRLAALVQAKYGPEIEKYGYEFPM